MKRTLIGAAILMFGLALGAGISGEARAFAGGAPVIGGASGWDGAVQQVSHKKKHWKHKKHHNNHWNRHRSGVFITLGNVFGGHNYNRHNYNNGWHQSGNRNCHGVVNNGYYHGRYAKIGGTVCYDYLGRGFIVEGSRYLIHYY